jgi:queuine tRNA-ribosyltransferase
MPIDATRRHAPRGRRPDAPDAPDATRPFPELDPLDLRHGPLALPAFLPDATLGVVRAVDSVDLLQCGVQALVMNTFHLMQHPGSSTVQALGGLHAMAAWPRPIVTDSGGFQAYSLIRQNAKYGSLTDNGIVFRPEGSNRKLLLTPEKCVQLQMSYGADVVMCLDDCTHVDDPPAQQGLSVQRTVEWARRCKDEFTRLLTARRQDAGPSPLLFGVVQGGGSLDLRRACAAALLEIGFDGYGYGGWPLDRDGNLVEDLLAYTRALIPRHLPMHALGVGHPASIATCVAHGYGLFDSALPTRDARHGRLYAFQTDRPAPRAGTAEWFRFVYVTDAKYIKDARPVDPTCDCLTCTHYARGYLYHLFKSNESAFQRLATIHNLRFMARLMEALRAAGTGDRPG